MLKRFADDQRQKKREGFHRQDVNEPVVLDHALVKRRTSYLANLPANLRNREEGFQNGRNQYLNHLPSHQTTMANFKVQEIKMEDDGLNLESETRQNLFLRKQMKRPGIGLQSRREIPPPQPRKFAVPPANFVPIVEDQARQEYTIRKQKNDRDPNWEPVAEPLKHVQNVHLEPSTQRLIYEMSADPVRQRNVNILRGVEGEIIPSSQIGLSAGTNPDSVRHKPRIVRKDWVYSNQDYINFHKPKKDLNLKPIPPTKLGVFQQEERHNAGDVGVASDLNLKTTEGSSRSQISQEQVFYSDGNRTISGIDMRAIPQKQERLGAIFENRDFATKTKADLQGKSTVPSNRQPSEQQEINYSEKTKLDINGKVSYENARGNREFENREFKSTPDISVPLEAIKFKQRQNIEFKDRDFEEANRSIDYYGEPILTSTVGMVDGEARDYSHSGKPQVDTETRQFKSMGKREFSIRENEMANKANADLELSRASERGLKEYEARTNEQSVKMEMETTNVPLSKRDLREYETRPNTEAPQVVLDVAGFKSTRRENGEFITRDNDQVPKISANYENTKSILRDQGQYEQRDFLKGTKVEVSKDGLNFAKERKEGEQKDIVNSLSERTSVDIGRSVPVLRREPLQFGQRDFETMGKLSVSQNAAPTQQRQNFQQEDLSYLPLPKTDVEMAKNRELSRDVFEQKQIDFSKAPRAELEQEILRVQKILGLQDLRKRDSAPFQNADMDFQKLGNAKTSLIKVKPPREFAAVNKKDYEDPDVARDELSKIKIRGAINGERILAVPIQELPEMSYPGSARGSTPRKHENPSRLQTPRSTPSKVNQRELQRMQDYGQIPEPFK